MLAQHGLHFYNPSVSVKKVSKIDTNIDKVIEYFVPLNTQPTSPVKNLRLFVEITYFYQ